MNLGPIELQRRTDLDTFTRATLLRAYRASDEPRRSLVLYASVGLCCVGPKDWPAYRGQDYDDYGKLVKAYLGAHNVDPRATLSLASMAVESIAREPEVVTDTQVEEWADFFGVNLDSGSSATSPESTKDQPSED
jgi:hypothetical protein